MQPFRSWAPARGSARAALAIDLAHMNRQQPANETSSHQRVSGIRERNALPKLILLAFAAFLLAVCLYLCAFPTQAKAAGTQAEPASQQIMSPIRFLHWAIPEKSPVTAFVHVNLIPMVRQEVVADQTVIVRAGHIDEIGKTGELAVPPNAVVIDATEKYLIPGLIDMRVRLCSPAELLLYLANGVTMVRSLDSRPQQLAWRDNVSNGTLLGPIIYAVGPTISAPTTSAQAKQATMQEVRQGYDAVEAASTLPAEAFHGITAAARVLGLSVFGGVNLSVGLKDTIVGPQFFSLEQTQQFAQAVFEDNPQTSDAEIMRAADQVRDGSVWFTPSLVSLENGRHLENSWKRLSPAMEYLPPQCRLTLSLGGRDTAVSPSRWAFYKRIVAIMQREKVPMILGTDSMAGDVVPGFSVQQELEYLVEAGLSPFEALRTATRNASEWYVHPEGGGVFGTITLHERADLVLLDANPLSDIRNAAKIRGVMAQGRWLPQPELQKMLQSLPPAYADEKKFLTAVLRDDPAASSKYLQENDPYHRLTTELLVDMVTSKGVGAFKQFYDSLQKTEPESMLTQDSTLIDVGHRLLELKRNSDALGVLNFDVESHAQSARAYDALARAYLAEGNRKEALHFFKESVRVDPAFQPATLALNELEEHDGKK